MLHCYRVTKYNPRYRDSLGNFKKNDWIASNEVKSLGRYLEIENKYVSAAIGYLGKCGIPEIAIRKIENRTNGGFDIQAATVSTSNMLEIDILIRIALREQAWFMIEGEDGFHIHFGYDYYMYLGGGLEIKTKRYYGLYVEEYRSPYLE